MVNPLKAYLALNDISGVQFAERLGVHPSYLGRLIRGEREADTPLLSRIETATAGEVTPDKWVKWWRKTVRASA
jgi:DNA-binding transcriptional regulator YdaS (Cro superfamily)